MTRLTSKYFRRMIANKKRSKKNSLKNTIKKNVSTLKMSFIKPI